MLHVHSITCLLSIVPVEFGWFKQTYFVEERYCAAFRACNFGMPYHAKRIQANVIPISFLNLISTSYQGDGFDLF